MLRFAPALAVLLATAFATPAAAQDRRPSHCISLVDSAPGMQYLHKASFGGASFGGAGFGGANSNGASFGAAGFQGGGFGVAGFDTAGRVADDATMLKAGFADPLEDFTVRINYVAHATFLIETQGGVTAATDYTGFLGPVDFVPDVVTMNRAHTSHFTTSPDPRIPHVLPGWNPEGGKADHHVDLGEMLVRNVSTDIRSSFAAPELGRDGNSIFVFEVAGLCVGHLGHLHHEPTPEQYAALGRLDVVMAPVDGGLTLDLSTMSRLLERMRSSIVIPMHWFGRSNLETFISRMSESFAIERSGESFVEVSLRTLPDRPTVMVLEPSYLTDDDD